MGSAYFRTRSESKDIYCSYTIFDGKEPSDLSPFYSGDEFIVMWDINREVYDAVKNSSIQDFRNVYRSPGATREEFKATAHIPFVVVERSHCCMPKEYGKLQILTRSIIVEAKTDYWEELFFWISTGIRPDWALVKKSDRPENSPQFVSGIQRDKPVNLDQLEWGQET